jgi:shikimate kinase
MPGSGKTATGRALARAMSRTFADLDEEIARRAGKTITRIFSENGEEYFRDLETEELKRAVARGGQVLATGGGIVTREANWDILRASGVTVYLRTSLASLARRALSERHRPLLELAREEEREARLGELLKRRGALYERADLAVDTDAKTPEEVALEIRERLKT